MTAKTIELKCKPDNEYYLTTLNKKELFLFIELTGCETIVEKDRIPLNISLVIDRSGSMQGEKLEYAKKALDFVVQNLNSGDIMSVVQYDDRIDVLVNSQSIKNKEHIKALIAKITARNNTNLSGGMLEGFNQVSTTKRNNCVNRVLLLSDGLANEGITDHAKLQDIAQKKFREEGIGLSTFGVGADFNEVLMTNLAEYGGANYYFIENPDKIPTIFAEELQGLLSVVSQNNKLEIKFPAEYVKTNTVFGYPANFTNNQIFINFNDIFASETKSVLIKFDVLKEMDKEINFDIKLTYDDVNTTLSKISENVVVNIKPTINQDIYTKSADAQVLENISFYIANTFFEQAIKEVDNRNFEKAKTIIFEIQSYLIEQLKIQNNPQKLLDKLQLVNQYGLNIENLRRMDLAEFSISQKTSRHLSYHSRKGKSIDLDEI